MVAALPRRRAGQVTGIDRIRIGGLETQKCRRGARSATRKKGKSGGGKPVDKPGSVVDSHSSRRTVTSTLKQPTRKQREPRRRFPIWPCSGWGLPCRPCYHERGELLPRRFTLTCPACARTSAVCFLLHFPSPHGARSLTGILLCGARTFLSAPGFHPLPSGCLTDFPQQLYAAPTAARPELPLVVVVAGAVAVQRHAGQAHQG